MNWKPLDHESTTLYKGIAIIMIVIHNFMHVFPGSKESEFVIEKDYFISFLNIFWQHPENSIQALFSFLGHFGVQIFIFLSAYGLTKKFMTQKPEYWPFIFKRFRNIYPSFLLAILLWAAILGWWQYGLSGPLKVLLLNAESLFLKLTLLSNFFSGEALQPVGPWWFIPFIFQFYFIFPFLFNLYQRWGDILLISLATFSIAFVTLFRGHIGEVNIYLTILGHMPEFLLGMFLAKNDRTGLTPPILVLILAGVMFVLGNIVEPLWYLTHLSFLIILLFGFNFLVPIIKNNILSKKIVLFIGSISMALFLVNGFLRRPFISLAEKFDYWLMTIVVSFMFLLVCIVIAVVLMKVEKYLSWKLNQILQK